MVSNSVVKNDKLPLTFVSETNRFQNLYRLVSFFRISSRKSVDTSIQQIIKFDVLSASFIFLLTLFYSFKARYKKEIYSFLIGQNLPGIANLSQKTFKETSRYVFPFQNEPFLKSENLEPQCYFDTNFIEHDLTHFYKNQAIKLKKKQTFPKENLILNGKTLQNFYNVKYNNSFEKESQFIPSIYYQTKCFNKNEIKNTFYKPNLLSSYHLAFQSFAAKNFGLSTIKTLEKEGAYLKLLELPLNCDFYFGVFQKKDITLSFCDAKTKFSEEKPQLSEIKENIFKFPVKKDSSVFGVVATCHPLPNKIPNKSQIFLTKTKSLDWNKFYKQNQVIRKTLFQKSQKKWFCLGQNKSLQTQWFSIYKNNLSKKYSHNLKEQKDCGKLKTQPFLLDKLFSIFYNVNNFPKSRALHSHITREHNLENFNNNEKEAFTFVNWWHFIFNGDFSLNSNFIIENIDFPFFQWGKSSILIKQKQETALRKGKTIFSYKKFKLDEKWKKRNYQNYLQLDEFPSKLSSIFPLETLIDKFFTKKTRTLTENVIKRKRESLDSSKKKKKPLAIKQKFILRGSKSLLNISELNFTKQRNFNLQNKSTTSINLSFSESSTVKDLNSKFKQQEKAENSLLKKKEEALFLQKKTNSNQTSNHLNDSFSLPRIDFTEENQSKTFRASQEGAKQLFPKSFKLRFLRNEIKAIFSSSQKNYDFIKKEEKTFNLLSNKLLTSLDDILLSNAKLLQGENQVSQNENLETLFEFLPQKNCSIDPKVLQNMDNKILFHKNLVEQDTEETSPLTQKKNDLTNFNGKLKNKEHLKLKYRKKFTQLLQDFWSKKDDILSSCDARTNLQNEKNQNGSDFLTENVVLGVFNETKNKKQKLRKDFTEKIKESGFTFFIKYLSTQPRLMSGYQFPDLNTKEIDKLIKYSNSKKNLANKTHFIREISFFINNFRKNKISRFQNPMWSIFSQISKKEICQQHPIDVYLPNNYIQRLPQNEYNSLQKNLFFDKKAGSKGIISSVTKLPRANDSIELKKSSEPSSLFYFNKGKHKLYQAKKDKKIVLQNIALLSESVAAEPQSLHKVESMFDEKVQSTSLERGNLDLKPLKFISKSLRLENNIEKQSFFVYQIPALLKIPSIWNPRFQKLQIAKTINKSKSISPSMVASPQSLNEVQTIDFSKNLLSSTNFLTDRKQHFFAIGNQVEKEQENCFIQRPLSGSFFGLFYNKTNSNLQSKSLFKINLKNKGFSDTELRFSQSENLPASQNANVSTKIHFGKGSGSFCETKRDKPLFLKSKNLDSLPFTEQKLGKCDKNSRLIRKDFSILPLLSKATVKEKDSFANQLSFAPIMSSLHDSSNFTFSEENFKNYLEKIDKTSKTFLSSSTTYKTYPKSSKSITRVKFYSFFDVSAFDSLRSTNFQIKTNRSKINLPQADGSLPFDKTEKKSLRSKDCGKAATTFLNNCLPSSKTFTDLAQNNSKFDQLSLTKKIIENSKLNIKRKQLSDKCDKQINTLQLVLPFLETDTFTTTWTKWLSSRYKKPAISYRFQKKVFYLPSDKKVDFFLQQKNRYQKNKWGKIEQQENRSKKGERDEDSLTSFSEQVYLPLTIKRSIYFPNKSKIILNKNSKFSFFTTKPLFLQDQNRFTFCDAGRFSQSENIRSVSVFSPKNLVLAEQKLKKSILPQKKLSFLPKTIWQEESRVRPKFSKSENQVSLHFAKQNVSENSSWKNRRGDDSSFSVLDGKRYLVRQIPPLSYFLSDTLQKDQTSLSYLKRFDTNCDRLDWQFYQWYPFLQKKYAYSPPSQSILNEEFLNNFFKNKIRKRNTIYKYSRHFLSFCDAKTKTSTKLTFGKAESKASLDTPILKFRDVKSKALLPKISTLQSENVQDKVSLHFAKQNARERSDTLNTFRKTYSLSYLQNKQSFSNFLFPKIKKIDLCWEPITIRSWMIITQYSYAFFLVQSTLYVYDKHMKKVLLSFAPLLSGRGILSGIPSFGEKLQDFLGGSTIDKNVLLFKKVSKRFQDIVAIDNKLPQLSEIVWFLRNLGRTTYVNKIQGVLFVGPPGTGKTLLVQAIAGEAEVPVLVLSGSSFADGKKDKKSGQLLKRVFQRARILAPSILFIDEIDTLGESRSHFAQDDRDQKNESSRIIESISQTEGKIQGKPYFSQNRKNQSVKQVGLLTQFLVEMDGLARQQKSSSFFNNKITFGKSGGILVIGSTNRPKVLDPALTRPGRFDQVFYLSNPGKQKRIEILKIYTKNIGVSPFLPWDYLGDRTLGFSAADLSAIVNKSTIQAILSHTIHTIQSIEDGVESLPKLSQNKNKSFLLEENDLSTSFLFSESQQFHNESTILCKSILTSLTICVKHLNLQNKYENFSFLNQQSKSYQNFLLKFSHKGTLSRKLGNLKKYKEPLQKSFGNTNLQEKKERFQFDNSLSFYTDNLVFAKQRLRIGISFLGRLPFYQAGKVMVQLLFSQNSFASGKLIDDRLDQRSIAIALPMPLIATLNPKQELSFLNMFKESSYVKEVTNCNQLETRLISGYAGKAAEILLVSGLQFCKNIKTTVTWQSTLGVEEWKLTNSLAYSMIFKYYFYSQRVTVEKENFIALSQNSNEILEIENSQVLQNIFFKEELEFSQEKQDLELSEGKNNISNVIAKNKSFLNPIIWISNIYQQYEITKIFGHIEENNWYQVYLPPLVKDEQNKEWVPLDQYYFGRENLIELIWNTYKNKSINWNDIFQLDSDLTYQGLVIYHFNKALSLLDQNRELLDLFANLLISFRIIRRHEILKIFFYFKYYNTDSKNF